MTSSLADRMFVVQLGAERVPKALSIPGAADVPQWEPFIAVVVETSEGWVLLDSGMSRAAYENPLIEAAYRADEANWHGAPPARLHPFPPDPDGFAWLAGADPLAEALGTIGLTVADLHVAAVSHLHVDHSGGIPSLAASGVPVVIGRDELEFVRSGAVAESAGFHPADWSHPRSQWIELTADHEIAPGVTVLATPGHTPGHQSFEVRLPDTGTWIFAADAADLGENFHDGHRCGSIASGTDDDARRADESFARLLRRAGESEARLIPGHDQLVLNAIRHPSGGHR